MGLCGWGGPGLTIPRTVRASTNSPIAVISHSPENWRINFAIFRHLRDLAT